MSFLAKRKENQKEPVPVERRTKPRVCPRNGTFAFLDLKAMVAGQILNINDQGLCFRYVASEQQSTKSCSVTIIERDWDFRSTPLACEIVWDNAQPQELSFGPFSVRYCGLQFGELTEEQQLDLDYFIHQYTKDDTVSNQ